MPTTKTPRKKAATKKTAKKAAVPKAAAVSPLVLKRETVADLQALVKQTTKVRQSRKVCIA